MEVSGNGSCTETGSEDPTRDGSCLVFVEDVKNLGSLVEQEMEKVGLVEGFEVLGVAHMGFAGKTEFVDEGESKKTGEIGNENGLKFEIVEDDGLKGRDIGVEKIGVEGSELGNGLKGREIDVEKIGVEGSELGSDSIQRELGSDGDESDSSSESKSESESSSSSSDSEDEESSSREEAAAGAAIVKEEEEEEEGEVEEGEIRGLDEYNMIEFSEDEDGGGIMKGPIRSKHELENLPPVPPVDVTLEPHHQTLPVGVVLSILESKVIIEGVEKHNPLNEGSILWITETRSPLGLVDEIFGPVKNPYYVVRFNSDDEVPAGIHGGTSVSFVPEFANHILNDKNLYKKGYDASNENDEELSDDAEFSDDEKEAEYKRMLKMKKRGVNDQKPGNKMKGKKGKNRDVNWKNGQQKGNYSCVPGTGNVFAGGPATPVPQFPPMPQAAGFSPQQNVVWPNGIPYMQQQGTGFPNAMIPDGTPWLQQNPFLMPFPNGMPFQPQFDPSQLVFPNVMLPPGQPNTFVGPAFAPWPGIQNAVNQTTFGMGAPGVQFNGLPLQQQNMGLQSGAAVIPGNFEASRQYNEGTSSVHGNNFHRRGGGRFGGGRGRQQSK